MRNEIRCVLFFKERKLLLLLAVFEVGESKSKIEDHVSSELPTVLRAQEIDRVAELNPHLRTDVSDRRRRRWIHEDLRQIRYSSRSASLVLVSASE